MSEIDLRERERVARVVADDIAYRAEKAGGIIDSATGEPKRIRPTDLTTARRRIAANGMAEDEAVDTIGKLWAWGLLRHPEVEPDLLRDAGRRYAIAYWHRYGMVCAKSGAYAEMTRSSGGGPAVTWIADEDADIRMEESFRRRDDALRDAGRKVKIIIDQLCVDGAGDNDPGWLADLMLGYPAETREARLQLSADEAMLMIGDKESRRRAKRRHDDARRALDRLVRELKVDRVPHRELAAANAGLMELAKIDRAEGLHRPKRPRKDDERDE